MTLDARALGKRVLLALGAALLLLAPWPLVRTVYAPAFRTLAQLAVNVADPLPGAIETRFEPGTGGVLAVDMARMDTVVRLRHRDLAGADASFGASSFFHGYLPTAVLLALFAAATPLPWRARRAPLVRALVLLHLFFALRCVLATYYACTKCNIDGRPLVDLGPAAARVLFLGWHFAWEEAFTNYLVPILLWAVCVFGPRPPAEAVR